jgi:hypothetical protein
VTKARDAISGQIFMLFSCGLMGDHGLASGACNTALQAGGSAAIVIGGFGFGGSFGGFGCSTASLNQ